MIIFFSGDGDHGKSCDPEVVLGEDGSYMLSYWSIMYSTQKPRLTRNTKLRRERGYDSVCRSARRDKQG